MMYLWNRKRVRMITIAHARAAAQRSALWEAFIQRCQFTRRTLRCHIRTFCLISWLCEAYQRAVRPRGRTMPCRRVWPFDIWRFVSLHRTAHAASPLRRPPRTISGDVTLGARHVSVSLQRRVCACVNKTASKDVFGFHRFSTEVEIKCWVLWLAQFFETPKMSKNRPPKFIDYFIGN